MTSFPNIMDATTSILIEACSALNSIEAEYVIVGGWSPYLRVKNHQFTHPGTRDVDILFNCSQDQIATIAKIFIQAGYRPSAKHEFQLLKSLTITEHHAEGSQKYLFNIDLLYPGEPDLQERDLFQDIMDFRIPIREGDNETHWMKSIALIDARIIFERSLWSKHPVTGIDPYGNKRALDINLMDESGTLLSKASSVKSAKRPRDAFDIYYVLTSDQSDKVVESMRRNLRELPRIRENIQKLFQYVEGNRHTFNERVEIYAKTSAPYAAQTVLEKIDEILRP